MKQRFTCLAAACVVACSSSPTQSGDAGNDDAGSDVIVTGGGDAGDAAADAGFDVGALSGLALWLDATRGVTLGDGGTIASWKDQSSNANVLTGTVHPNGALAIDPSGMNGHPAVKIDGPADFYEAVTPTGFAWGNDDYLVEAVVSVTNTQRLFNVFENNKTVVDISINFTSATPTLVTTGSGGPITVDGPSALAGAHILGMQQKVSTNTVDLRIDGNVVASSPGTGTVAAATQLELGYGGNGMGNVEVAELIVLHGAISDTDRGKLEAHLKARYGL